MYKILLPPAETVTVFRTEIHTIIIISVNSYYNSNAFNILKIKLQNLSTKFAKFKQMNMYKNIHK